MSASVEPKEILPNGLNHPSSTLTNNTNDDENSHGPDLEANNIANKSTYHRLPPFPPTTVANPAPLGLIGFACSIFLLSVLDLEPRGIKHPDVMVGNLIFFGGVAQFVAGLGEFFLGNTVSWEPSRDWLCVRGRATEEGAPVDSLKLTLHGQFSGTVFCSYAAFNFALAMIHIPSTGIITAYLDPKTHEILPEFPQALSIVSPFLPPMPSSTPHLRRRLSPLIQVSLELVHRLRHLHHRRPADHRRLRRALRFRRPDAHVPGVPLHGRNPGARCRGECVWPDCYGAGS